MSLKLPLAKRDFPQRLRCARDDRPIPDNAAVNDSGERGRPAAKRSRVAKIEIQRAQPQVINRAEKFATARRRCQRAGRPRSPELLRRDARADCESSVDH
jgi:hypothetical protein